MKIPYFRPLLSSIFSVTSLFGLAGCAYSAPPPMSHDHPAHAQAEEAPPPPASGTLGVPATEPAAAPEAADPHAGHHHGAAASQPTTRAAFVCPMHPQITSDQPGRCAICNMELKPVGEVK